MELNKYNKRRKEKIISIYSRGLLTRNISLPLSNIGMNISGTIETFIKFNYEGKCMVEGYIKPDSVKIITFSSGEVIRGHFVSFVVTFECLICFPVEGMIIKCIAQNITKAGIKAESYDEHPSPVVVFIAKDHNYNNDQFSEVKINDEISVRVIGQRFELNDKYVSIIGELIRPIIFNKEKPRIVIED
jgi:DNA-directed RNA polymerase subunit E'/Rpb7